MAKREKMVAEEVVKPEIRIDDFETMLRAKLNNEELVAYAREMGDVNAEIGTLEQNAKSIAKEFASKIAQKEARRSTLGLAITSGAECRMVKCERVYNYVSREVFERRLDNQEPYVINLRKMREDELQKQLDL